MSNVISLVQRRMNFRKGQYAAFAFETDCGVDLAEGNILDVLSDAIVVAYNNVRGPVTKMTIPFTNILERFE